MPDQLTVPPSPGKVAAPRPRGSLRTPLVQALVTVLLLVTGGAAAGWGVHRLWDPPVGMVYEGGWYRGLTSVDPPTLDVTADQHVFAGVGWFTVLGLTVGLLVGLVVALWLSRSELVALAAVTVGGLVGGGVMYAVARALAPASPGTRERAASWLDEGATAPDTLHVSPWLAVVVPAAGLLALALVYLLIPGRSAGDAPVQD